MDDLISRQAVRHILNHEVKIPINVWKKLFELVDNLPSVQPEQKTGHWIKKMVRGSEELYCSNCGNGIDVIYEYNYCPNCGIKMVESQESED